MSPFVYYRSDSPFYKDTVTYFWSTDKNLLVVIEIFNVSYVSKSQFTVFTSMYGSYPLSLTAVTQQPCYFMTAFTIAVLNTQAQDVTIQTAKNTTAIRT